MEVDFRTYDKAPIVGVVSISKWSFGLREIILAGIGILLLIMCLIFAGLFGHAEKKLADDTPSALADEGQTYCMDLSCLRTASRALSLMNTSVDPCEDFFQYACGNYKNVKPILEERDDDFSFEGRTVLDDLRMINKERLTQILEKPIQRKTDWSSERKLKEFFQSCNDMRTREAHLGTPFLQRVVPALGGWDLLGTWDEANWDFNTTLKKVSSDYLVSAFFTTRVRHDSYSWTKHVIELEPSSLESLVFFVWDVQPHVQKFRDDYEFFIRRVGSLFMRDAKLSMDADTQAAKLDQFVNDTFTMEIKIYDVDAVSHYGDSKPSLSELNTETDNVINWIDHFTYMFPGARISGSTKIVLKRGYYFQSLTRMISSLPDQDRKRMLHHYLIWKVAEIYVQNLSWEYIHAKRDFYVNMFEHPEFASLNSYCFSKISFHMRDALGSLFISNHFSDTHKKQVHDITDNLKKALEEQLEKTSWMDAPTKAIAKDKLSRTVFKLGYPDWMANHDAVDSLYAILSVNVSDFLGNIVNANKFIRSTWSNDLLHGDERHEWLLQTYATEVKLYLLWNEILTPAGILQSPVYDYKQPHYSTFGSLGTLMGRLLHQIVDSRGQHYDSEGNYVDKGWWTNKTLSLYKPVKDCVTNVYKNASSNDFFQYGYPRDSLIYAKEYSPKAISTINGIRLSLKGYRKWVSERGISEKMLPGVGLTDAQMLFLSHAQTFCFDRKNLPVYFEYLGKLVEDLQVNIALGQLKEFSDTFQCKPTAKMNSLNKCDYY